MRFFKSFPGFLHRRSRSDSSIPKPNPAWDHILLNRPQSLDASEAALLADAHVPASPRAYVSHADSRNALFELEAANRLLKTDLCTWSNKYYNLKSQLETTRSDLFSTLHQNSVLERESHFQRADLRALQEKLMHYERYLELIINVSLHQRVLGDAHAAVRAGIDPDQALVDAIKQAAADPGSAWSSIVPRVAGSRTPDEYKSSLSLTLKTRRDLRDARKIAKFWKQVAAEAGKSDIVTPSPSNVSSIHDALPPQRQRAVEELISKRRASMALHPANENDIVGAPIVSVLSLPETAHSSDLGYEPPCLSPLASESFKTEIAGFSSNQRLFKRTVFQSRGRPVLALLDQNVKNTSVSINRKKPVAKRGQRAENMPMTVGQISVLIPSS
ncbi:unnamed protein product [Mycena citricolor]|uniref:Uncharacterized protein n=1 Tax=Mycena citricolor TaxID=2018698 RepID=A0AAD2HQX9_9AGAR|nr:unnamed protein product [Mycena citricolor]